MLSQYIKTSYTMHPIKQDHFLKPVMVTFTNTCDCVLHSCGAYPQYHTFLLFKSKTVCVYHIGHNMSSSLQLGPLELHTFITISMLMPLMIQLLHWMHEINSPVLKVSGKFSKSKYKAMISCLDKNNAQCLH